MSDLSALDGLFSRAVLDGTAAGVTAVVVDRAGVRYLGGAGERTLDTGVDMTPDTLCAIWSMTKPITGAACMHAVERGLLDLDQPAGEIVDELTNLQVLSGFTGAGEPTLRDAEGHVTLRNLLTHTSGFVYDLWNADLGRWAEATDSPSGREASVESLKVPLVFDPGSRWEYGIGIDWAGVMVERASGMRLGAYFEQHITGPLGMHDTAFTPTRSTLERLATTHARTADGGLAPIDLALPTEPTFDAGGGGLYGTVQDYGRFLQMVLNDGELDGARILTRATIETMAENHIGDLRVQMLPSSNPMLTNDAELFPGDEKSWGLTWQRHEHAASTGRPAGTLMWAGLANCYFWIDRANDIAGAYLSQLLPFADERSIDVYTAFETMVYDSL